MPPLLEVDRLYGPGSWNTPAVDAFEEGAGATGRTSNPGFRPVASSGKSRLNW
jgi:hypothetical protein